MNQIIGIKGKYHYYDVNGVELHDGDTVIYRGEEMKVYLTENDELGFDATNPALIKAGRAVPCSEGVYPFDESDMEEMVKK